MRQRPGVDHLGHRPLGLREHRLQAVDEEPAQARVTLVQSLVVAQGVRLLLVAEILGDAPAEHHTRVHAQVQQGRIERLAADVVEHDIEPFGQQFAEARLQILAAVVDGRVIAEPLDQHPTLLGAAGDADHPARAMVLGDLRDARPDAARCARHQHPIATLQLPDVHETEIGRETGHPQHADAGGERCDALLDLVHHEIRAAVADRILLPAQLALHELSGREPRVTRRHHDTDASAAHDLSELQRSLAGAALQHVLPHHRRHREIERPDQELAVAEPRDRLRIEREIRLAHFATGWAVGEHPSAIERRRQRGAIGLGHGGRCRVVHERRSQSSIVGCLPLLQAVQKLLCVARLSVG